MHIWWNRVKWIFKSILELNKKSYPLVRLGVRILLLAVATPALSFALTIFLLPTDPIPFLNQFGITISTITDKAEWMSIALFTIASVLITIGIYTAQKQARRTAKVLITSMLGDSARFPDELLFESEKLDTRETVKLGLSEDSDYLEKSIKMFNAEKMVDVYHRFILHHNCKKVYLGGRTRVPFLVAYGSCFRSISAKIVYFDQLHQDNKWHLLDDEDKEISLVYEDINNLEPNADGDIGLALSFTNQVRMHQVPDYVRDHTLYVSPNITANANLFKNQDNLEHIADTLKQIINELSAKEHCRCIHLFLSVQTSVALELGRKYQEGMHRTWIIHNFEGRSNQYEWAIELNANGIKRFEK